MNKSLLISMNYEKKSLWGRLGILGLVLAYSAVFVVMPSSARAQVAAAAPAVLPAASLLAGGPAIQPVRLKGLKVFPEEPFKFEVLVDKGDTPQPDNGLKDDITRLSKYFLACLAVPDQDLWVNLSPYEKDRVAPEMFGMTQMGKDLLEQDYALKQMASAITYPETPLGARFWKSIYTKVFAAYGTTDVPALTFNKVWILPKSGQVYVRGESVFVVKSELDVMLDVDHKALKAESQGVEADQYVRIYTEAFRDIILPELRRQVNTSREFVPVRQVYDALILATWYKRHLRSGILSKIYVGANKVSGIDTGDVTLVDQVYARYLKAAREGAYSYIKEEEDPASHALIARKYFSGGIEFPGFAANVYNEAGAFSDEAMAGAVLVKAPLELVRTGALGPDRAQSFVPRSPWVRRFALLAALVFAGMSLAPTVEAATFAAAPGGHGVIAMVQKGDTAGDVLVQLRQGFKKIDPQGYAQSALHGHLWGADGVAQRVLGGQNVDHLHSGDTVSIGVDMPASGLPGMVSGAVGGVSTGASAVSAAAPAVALAPVAPAAMVAIVPVVPEVPVVTPAPEEADLADQPALKSSFPPLNIVALERALAPSNWTNGLPSLSVHWPEFNARTLSFNLQIGAMLAVAGLGFVGAAYAWQSRRKPAGKGVNETQTSTEDSLPAVQPAAMSPEEAQALLRQNLAESERRLAQEDIVPPPNGIDPYALLKENLKKSEILLAQSELSNNGIRPEVQDAPAVRVGAAGKAGKSGYFLGAILPIFMFGFDGGISMTLIVLSSVIGFVGAMLYGQDGFSQAMLFCGINGLFGFVMPGDAARDLRQRLTKLLDWQRKMLKVLEDRGGQQMGIFTFLRRDPGAAPELAGTKNLKSKRWLAWQDGALVFYPDVIGQMVRAAARKVPGKAITTESSGGVSLWGWNTHVRFATGGEIVEDAAHPHSSRWEFKPMDYFDGEGVLRSARRWVSVMVGHNGDNDAVHMGPSSFEGRQLGFGDMRRFFPAVIHNYYEGKVTAGYLKKTIEPLMGKLIKAGHAPLNYSRILRELVKSGYVVNGRVSRRFIGLDDRFRGQFPEYERTPETEGSFALIESALYGLPPGDSPVIPLQIHLYLTQGNWAAAARYAHVMGRIARVQDIMSVVMTEADEESVGEFFRGIFDSWKELLQLRGIVPADRVKSLTDLWFDTGEEARAAGLTEQYVILQNFKLALEKKMRTEALKSTPAGRVFARWEQEWAVDGNTEEGAGHLRRDFIDTAVRKYFTGTRASATREFARRSDGTYGIFVRSLNNDDGITLYSNQQDVAVGLNRDLGLFSFASDPRVLKTRGPDGETLSEVIHLQDGEVMNVTSSLDRQLEVRSWMVGGDGVSREVAARELEQRFYPTAQVLADGTQNPYYAAPPIVYKQRRKMVQEELDSTAAVIARAEQSWVQPETYNRRSAQNLARRLATVSAARRGARLVLVGYDNSRIIPDILGPVLEEIAGGVKVEVIDANDFIADPDAFHINDGKTVALVISKSGATFPTKLAAKGLIKLAGAQNVFGMSSRIDSVLNTVLGQSLHPDDPFTGRVFVTGEFYSSEAPVLSEMLLMYQQVRLVFQLGKDLMALPGNPLGISIAPERLEALSSTVSEGMLEFAKGLTGVDEKGRPYKQDWDHELKKTGYKLGMNFKRPWIVNRTMDVILYSVFLLSTTLTMALTLTVLPLGIVPATVLIGVGATLDFLLFRYGLPYWISEYAARRFNLPGHGRLGARKLFMIAPDGMGAMMRNFVSRLYANGLSTTSPGAVYTGNSARDLVSTHGSDVNRGDILLNFTLQHVKHVGQMSISQLIFLKTGAFLGLNVFKGRAEEITVPIQVPHGNDERESRIIDATLGNFGLMMASKVIGVGAAMVSSFEGKLWNPGETTSRPGVHTTPTPHGVSAPMQKVLSDPGTDDDASDAAQIKGGIDLDARRLAITEQGSDKIQLETESGMVYSSVEGFAPRIGAVVALPPGAEAIARW
jgi:hypothetical protein